MANNPADFIKDIMSEPLGNLIAAIGKGVGEAQAALDQGSLNQTLEIYREDSTRPAEERNMIELMRSIGYQPTFYALPETEVEAQVSLSFNASGNSTTPGITGSSERTKVYAMPANAGNVNKYNLNVNAFAKLKFKIVPVPPPADLTDPRIVPAVESSTGNLISFNKAKELLAASDLTWELAGKDTDGNVTLQTPKAGALLKAGSPVTLTLAAF
jgi:hypothetical protein